MKGGTGGECTGPLPQHSPSHSHTPIQLDPVTTHLRRCVCCTGCYLGVWERSACGGCPQGVRVSGFIGCRWHSSTQPHEGLHSTQLQRIRTADVTPLIAPLTLDHTGARGHPRQPPAGKGCAQEARRAQALAASQADLRRAQGAPQGEGWTRGLSRAVCRQFCVHTWCWVEVW